MTCFPGNSQNGVIIWKTWPLYVTLSSFLFFSIVLGFQWSVLAYVCQRAAGAEDVVHHTGGLSVMGQGVLGAGAELGVVLVPKGTEFYYGL